MSIAFGFLLYNSTIVPSLLLAAFLVTFGVYGLNKVTDKAEDSINKPEWTTNGLLLKILNHHNDCRASDWSL